MWFYIAFLFFIKVIAIQTFQSIYIKFSFKIYHWKHNYRLNYSKSTLLLKWHYNGQGFFNFYCMICLFFSLSYSHCLIFSSWLFISTCLRMRAHDKGNLQKDKYILAIWEVMQTFLNLLYLYWEDKLYMSWFHVFILQVFCWEAPKWVSWV